MKSLKSASVLAAMMAMESRIIACNPRLTADYKAPNPRTPEHDAAAIEKARLKRERKAAKLTPTPLTTNDERE